MKLINNMPNKKPEITYADIDVGEVFEYEEHICIAVDDDTVLIYQENLGEWGVHSAPDEDDIVTPIECELILKSRK